MEKLHNNDCQEQKTSDVAGLNKNPLLEQLCMTRSHNNPSFIFSPSETTFSSSPPLRKLSSDSVCVSDDPKTHSLWHHPDPRGKNAVTDWVLRAAWALAHRDYCLYTKLIMFNVSIRHRSSRHITCSGQLVSGDDALCSPCFTGMLSTSWFRADSPTASWSSPESNTCTSERHTRHALKRC